VELITVEPLEQVVLVAGLMVLQLTQLPQTQRQTLAEAAEAVAQLNHPLMDRAVTAEQV
jgi:hypothetical protein